MSASSLGALNISLNIDKRIKNVLLFRFVMGQQDMILEIRLAKQKTSHFL